MTNYTDHVQEDDMDLSSIETANFDAMVAEEAILDWLSNLERDDTDYEQVTFEEEMPDLSRLAH
ncbi:MAG: hypothetical protein RQ729_12080 [Wenzhouxiangellaceae bacterium]|nr:hypothetical protein [Wenzhouxiangellaceae bacterium]